MEDERMYTVTEVADQLRLHPQTIREWLRDGTLEGVRLGGTKAGWRVSGSEIERYLNERRAARPKRGGDDAERL